MICYHNIYFWINRKLLWKLNCPKMASRGSESSVYGRYSLFKIWFLKTAITSVYGRFRGSRCHFWTIQFSEQLPIYSKVYVVIANQKLDNVDILSIAWGNPWSGQRDRRKIQYLWEFLWYSEILDFPSSVTRWFRQRDRRIFENYHKNFQKYWIFRLQSLMIENYRKIRLSRWRNLGFFENHKNFQKIYLSTTEDGKSKDIASGTQDFAKLSKKIKN